ncbi:hypothetical protein IIV22_157R [Invertebrate iridescent virus 22]|uniref:Uncharacterized protein n=1 Tax=Invertebrate iridescent virus 22 TaxID=345198 RepID=S6DDS4_9VIRU|nr:hypothetical protein IIV22_157R [Invertebrate iridescent virus 22]CCV01834.1 hypothetical protein IIV22_157R [Invertebrate iridescent virus 22]
MVKIAILCLILIIVSSSEASKCYCYNGMGAIEAGITSACCGSFGGRMDGFYCIVSATSSGFNNCCKASGAGQYGGGSCQN